jgi:hypothetical protein
MTTLELGDKQAILSGSYKIWHHEPSEINATKPFECFGVRAARTQGIFTVLTNQVHDELGYLRNTYHLVATGGEA